MNFTTCFAHLIAAVIAASAPTNAQQQVCPHEACWNRFLEMNI
ncbi:hypothetical protein PC129_g19896 [Phytophthora cactorum]|uniref:Uncharacterized protein n=1 Tax=Phytophthora cactorum TaxID=29920 RepID=A0A8T1H9K7_9STRA|nr:hypothetical protein PC114_g18765 [Phytophthora cactorum]KAG3024128.1 hypothetical protein PC120_g7197 [Phytophthora cactorum]KAG3103639.1 hypothetical protein PC121_g883 [Phytophthora cactorum]KAG3143661.1 hypothetical protein C6341_g19006 [Phytophthora cactorum]KAG3209085.1 hypothetical protein PC129_g19896 [Phytophthora cactorum]